MSKSSSVCALCGVTLQLKNNPSKEMIDGDKEIPQEREILLQEFDVVGNASPYKINSAHPKKNKVSDDFTHDSNPGSHLSPKRSDISPSYSPRQQRRIMEDSAPQSVDSELKAKLFFIRRTSSSQIIHHQINPPHEMKRRSRDNATQVLEYTGESERLASRFVSINEFPLLPSRSAKADRR